MKPGNTNNRGLAIGVLTPPVAGAAGQARTNRPQSGQPSPGIMSIDTIAYGVPGTGEPMHFQFGADLPTDTPAYARNERVLPHEREIVSAAVASAELHPAGSSTGSAQGMKRPAPTHADQPPSKRPRIADDGPQDPPHEFPALQALLSTAHSTWRQESAALENDVHALIGSESGVTRLFLGLESMHYDAVQGGQQDAKWVRRCFKVAILALEKSMGDQVVAEGLRTWASKAVEHRFHTAGFMARLLGAATNLGDDRDILLCRPLFVQVQEANVKWPPFRGPTEVATSRSTDAGTLAVPDIAPLESALPPEPTLLPQPVSRLDEFQTLQPLLDSGKRPKGGLLKSALRADATAMVRVDTGVARMFQCLEDLHERLQRMGDKGGNWIDRFIKVVIEVLESEAGDRAVFLRLDDWAKEVVRTRGHSQAFMARLLRIADELAQAGAIPSCDGVFTALRQARIVWPEPMDHVPDVDDALAEPPRITVGALPIARVDQRTDTDTDTETEIDAEAEAEAARLNPADEVGAGWDGPHETPSSEALEQFRLDALNLHSYSPDDAAAFEEAVRIYAGNFHQAVMEPVGDTTQECASYRHKALLRLAHFFQVIHSRRDGGMHFGESFDAFRTRYVSLFFGTDSSRDYLDVLSRALQGSLELKTAWGNEGLVGCLRSVLGEPGRLGRHEPVKAPSPRFLTLEKLRKAVTRLPDGDATGIGQALTQYAREFEQALLAPDGVTADERNDMIDRAVVGLDQMFNSIAGRAGKYGAAFGTSKEAAFDQVLAAFINPDSAAPYLETLTAALDRIGAGTLLRSYGRLRTALAENAVPDRAAVRELEASRHDVSMLPATGKPKRRARTVNAYAALFQQAILQPVGATDGKREDYRVTAVMKTTHLIQSLRHRKKKAARARNAASVITGLEDLVKDVKKALFGRPRDPAYRSEIKRLALLEALARPVRDAGFASLMKGSAIEESEDSQEPDSQE